MDDHIVTDFERTWFLVVRKLEDARRLLNGIPTSKEELPAVTVAGAAIDDALVTIRERWRRPPFRAGR
jgi:hypothetical protein